MKTVLIWPDVYREHGHWLPAISLAKSLSDAGYTVQFMGIPDCASIVSPYNAPFQPILEDIYPVGHTLNDRLEPEGQRWKPHHLLPLARGALDTFFDNLKPDLLIAGYFAGLEAAILHHRYQVPLITLTTYLRHPDEDPAIFAKGKLIYLSDPVAEKLIGLATRGNPDMDYDTFVQPLLIGPEMVPCPREFDFYDDDFQHDPNALPYVEPMVVRAALSGQAPAVDTSGIIHPIPAPDPANPNARTLIFGTSGSQVADYEDKARQFFHNLIAMMKTDGMTGYHLVLSLGDKLLEEFRVYYGVDTNQGDNDLPSNVSLAAWVDQLNILPRTKAVFMHGGLATIKEAIYYGTPLVIVPHGKDQGDNALRIQRAGVGIATNAGVLPATTLRSLFTQVTTSTWIAGRLSGMQGLFQAADAAIPKPSVNVVQALIGT